MDTDDDDDDDDVKPKNAQKQVVNRNR